jgi:hypothetical protein
MPIIQATEEATECIDRASEVQKEASFRQAWKSTLRKKSLILGGLEIDVGIWVRFCPLIDFHETVRGFKSAKSLFRSYVVK